MHYINITTHPDNLNFVKLTGSSHKTYTEKLKEKTGASRNTYIENGSERWGQLKTWLITISHGKCWYCEAKSNRAVLDIDHFRPKKGVTSYRKAIEYPSSHPKNGMSCDCYWWLTYEWKNYRLSCQFCNRKNENTGKGNEFPLCDETKRCFDEHTNIDEENPLFLDPCVESDCGLLAHLINGEVVPSAMDPLSWDYKRARYTIDTLHFLQNNVVEKRRKEFNHLNQIISLADRQNNMDVINIVKSQLYEKLNLNSEYLSFWRASIGTKQDIQWVAEVLESC